MSPLLLKYYDWLLVNHTFTSLDSIESFFPIRFFPHWAHDSSFVGVSVVGRLYSVQYKSIFGVPDKVRCNTCDKARDHWVRSEVLSPTPHWDMRWQSHHIITKLSSGCRTAFLHRCSVLDRPNTSDLLVIYMDLFSLDQARSFSF